MAPTQGDSSWPCCWWPVCFSLCYGLPEISGPSGIIKLGTHSLVLWALDNTRSVVLPVVTVDSYLQSRPPTPTAAALVVTERYRSLWGKNSIVNLFVFQEDKFLIKGFPPFVTAWIPLQLTLKLKDADIALNQWQTRTLKKYVLCWKGQWNMIFQNGVSRRVSVQFGPEVSATVLCGWPSSHRDLPMLSAAFSPRSNSYILVTFWVHL